MTGIKSLSPSAHNAVDGESVVFATLDIRFALAMIHGTGNELAVGYVVDQKTGKEEMYIDELVPDAFKLLANPGILYTLTDSGFISDPRLSHLELVSTKETSVSSETHVNNILDELKNYDIRFVLYENVLEEMKKRKKDPKNASAPHKSDRFD